VKYGVPAYNPKWPFWRLSLILIISLLVFGIATFSFVAIGFSVISFLLAYLFKREWERKNGRSN